MDCNTAICDYTTAGQPEHDPEPSPEPVEYALDKSPWAVLPMPADTDTPEWRREYLGEWSEPSPEPETTVERDGMGEYRISTVEKWCLPPKSYPGGWAVLPMPADTPTKYMRPSPIPPKPTAEDQAAKNYSGKLGTERAEHAATKSKLVTAIADLQILSGAITAEKSAHLDTRLKLVTALADLQALRESYAECVEAEADESEQMQRSAADHYGGAKSRLGSVPERVFHRGPYVSYCEED
jgi:hypothetical protein